MDFKQIIKYGIGVDVSKKEFHACIKSSFSDGTRKILSTKKFVNNFTGHKLFFEWINKHIGDSKIPCQLLVEVTGVYHENLLHNLYDLGIEVCLEMPRRVKRYLESIGHDSKTDKLDSKGIAEMACERKLKKWEPASKQIREIRALFRHRKSLIKNRTQLKNKLHAIEFSSIEGKGLKRSLNSMIKMINNEIEKVEKQTYKLSAKNKAFHDKAKMIANSMSGIGIMSVLTIVSETNGFEDFTSIKQLESYAGLDVIENSSGQHVGKTRISKKGNVHVRAALHMPSVSILSKKTKPYYGIYERIVKRNGGIKKKAMMALQRKILKIVYTLWKKNEPFDKEYELKRIRKNEAILV